MEIPGEVNQATGRAYQFAFIGALEGAIRSFENLYTVERDPDKTSFKGRTGKPFSFDFSGIYMGGAGTSEVFGESKGYRHGGRLLAEYRIFLAKAYVVTTDYQRHKNDLFWFVTNVPFGCTEGITIRSREFLYRSLTDTSNAPVREILGDGFIDRDVVYDLVDRIGVFILTDSFLMSVDLSYRVMPGDTIWHIVKKFHAGRVPSRFRVAAEKIAQKNDLPSPDDIKSGSRIRIPWFGLGDVPEFAVAHLDRSNVVEFIAASSETTGDPPLGGE